MKKVILNVGHGGVKRDPGACGNGFEEHAWNKDFVENYVKKECEAQEVPYVIIYQDYYSKLPDKINNLANKGDVTLSFHHHFILMRQMKQHMEQRCFIGIVQRKVRNWQNFCRKLTLKRHI